MAKVRVEDLMRSLLRQGVGAAAAYQKGKAIGEEQKREARQKAEAIARDLEKERRQRERQEEADRRARERDQRDRERREEEKRNPYVAGGNRFPTQEAMEEYLRRRAEITRAPRQEPRPPVSENPESVSRIRASAEGDAERWFSRGTSLTPEGAVQHLRKLYPKLTEGEAYQIASAAERKVYGGRGARGGGPRIGGRQ